MTEWSSPSDYLAVSRGHWDPNCSPDEIQKVMNQFYLWLERLVSEGKIKRGHRLTNEGRTVGRQNLITDGPFGESKEVIGGYWFIVADNLDEAVKIAQGNPCLDYGLVLEIRPIDPQVATRRTNKS
jgi:hypothetical protein